MVLSLVLMGDHIALTTGTYEWAKFFVPLLQDLTSNEYILKDSFEFAKVICEQNSDLYMASRC